MSAAKWVCQSCGTRQLSTGTGPRTCRGCGAVQTDLPHASSVAQPARPAGATAVFRRARLSGKGRGIAISACGILVLAALLAFWLSSRKAARQVAPIVDGAGTGGGGVTDVAAVGDTRIVTVTNPHIRVIPKGVDFEPEDLLRTTNTPPPASFDTKQFRIVPPRRMEDEDGETVFLGEVVNSSNTQTAISPTLSLTLSRGGHVIQKGDHVFPDMPAGAHLPLFFSFLEGPPAFDDMRFDWKPAQGYTVGNPGFPQLTVLVKSHNDAVIAGSSSAHPQYHRLHVTGDVTNRGAIPAKNVSLFILLRDAEGRLTGYSRNKIDQVIAPGDSVTFDGGAPQWGAPYAHVDVMVMPASPPQF